MLIDNGRLLLSRQDSAGYSCIDPPHYDDSTVNCAATVGGRVEGPYNNPEVASSTIFNSGPTDSPFASSGYSNLALCGTAFSQSYNVALKELGRYKLTATGMQTPCTVRHYTSANAMTGVTPPDEIISCNGLIPYSINVAKAQVWCSGWSNDWSGAHSFTQEECAEVAGGWTCGPTARSVPTYNGVLVPAAGIGVLGDGKKRAAAWAGPVVAGNLRNIREQQAKLYVDPGSTPYRAGQSVNGPTQPFVADPDLNSWVTGWNKIWNIGFQEASLPAKVWMATPTWFFKADFATTTISSVTVDWKTGALSATTETTYVPGTAECVGKPLNVDVNRARNTR